MDPAVIGVFIPIIAITLGMPLAFFGVWTQHKQKLAKIEASKTAGGTEQSARVEILEDRVAVLERIITDRGYNLASEIEALRDVRQDTGTPFELGRQAERQR